MPNFCRNSGLEAKPNFNPKFDWAYASKVQDASWQVGRLYLLPATNTLSPLET